MVNERGGDQSDSVEQVISIPASAVYFSGIFSTLLSFLLFGVPFVIVWGPNIILAHFHDIPSVIHAFLILSLSVGVGIIAHELIHVICIITFSGDLRIKNIKFGFNLKNFAFYIQPQRKITIKVLRISLVSPALVLGIIPSLIAVAMGNFLLLYFGMIFTGASCGDFVLLWFLRKHDSKSLIQSVPSTPRDHKNPKEDK